jgi:NAD-reducing hydrogenase large subunit
MHDLVTIDPVSRIEGHAKITIRLGEDGLVSDARFHVTEFRGFEEFCRGRPVFEMPSLTARTCGICPVSHLLASAKAGDAIMGVEPPPAALALRTLANLGQITQSHALSFFHLSAPDLLLGMDADPAIRNVFGLMGSEPEIARRGIRLRSYGQSIIEAIAGRKVHAPGIVPGGVAHPMTAETRDVIAAGVAEAKETAIAALELYLSIADRFQREIASFGSFPSLFLAIANGTGTWEHHTGHLKVIDATGAVVADDIDPAGLPHLPGRVHQQGLLPQVAVLETTGARQRTGGRRHVPGGSARPYQHGGTYGNPVGRRGAGLVPGARRRRWAVVVPLSPRPPDRDPRLHRADRADDRRPAAHRHQGEGRGGHQPASGGGRLRGAARHPVPRLRGRRQRPLTDVNLIIATGQNNLGMNATVAQIAREWITGPTIEESTLNRIEAGIRAYDPCLSCSTHAIGAMPMVVTLGGCRRPRRVLGHPWVTCW